MRNFLVGLMLGVLGTYWYLTQTEYTQGVLAQWWARASAAPVAPRPLPANRR